MRLIEHYEAECVRASVKYGVPVDIIKGRCRKRRHANCRHMVVLAMRKHSPDSLTAIGTVMGINHTSVLRSLQGDHEAIERWLLQQMTEDEAQAAYEAEQVWRARIEAEQTALAEATKAVRILSNGVTDCVTQAMASDCPWRKRWGLAIHHARSAGQNGEAVFSKYMKDLFPTTWQTPSAFA